VAQAPGFKILAHSLRYCDRLLFLPRLQYLDLEDSLQAQLRASDHREGRRPARASKHRHLQQTALQDGHSLHGAFYYADDQWNRKVNKRSFIELNNPSHFERLPNQMSLFDLKTRTTRVGAYAEIDWDATAQATHMFALKMMRSKNRKYDLFRQKVDKVTKRLW